MAPPQHNSPLDPLPVIEIDTRRGQPARSRVVAAALGVFLGPLGAHRFYLGYHRLGCVQLGLTCATLGIAGVWGILEGGMILGGWFGRDAAGARLAMASPGGGIASVGASGLLHLTLLLGLLGIASYTPAILAPPAPGVQSIELTASVASAESTAAVSVEMIPPETRESQPVDSEPAEPETTPPESVSPPPPPPALTETTRSEHQPQPTSPQQIVVAKSDTKAPASQIETEPSPSQPPPAASEVVPLAVSRTPSQATRPSDEADPPKSLPRQPAKITPPSVTKDKLNKDKVTKADPPPKPTPPQEHPEPPSTAAPAASASQASMAASASLGANRESLPAKRYSPPPIYPAQALAQGIVGRVVLRVTVDKLGGVSAAEVHKTSGNGTLDRAAIAAVKQWKFEPARRLGVAIETEIAVPIRFAIQQP